MVPFRNCSSSHAVWLRSQRFIKMPSFGETRDRRPNQSCRYPSQPFVKVCRLGLVQLVLPDVTQYGSPRPLKSAGLKSSTHWWTVNFLSLRWQPEYKFDLVGVTACTLKLSCTCTVLGWIQSIFCALHSYEQGIPGWLYSQHCRQHSRLSVDRSVAYNLIVQAQDMRTTVNLESLVAFIFQFWWFGE